MGWDIVSIGTHHKLPINKPEFIAEKLVQLIKNPIEMGYYEDWIYNPSQNKISHFDGIYPWIKMKNYPYSGGAKLYKFVDIYRSANIIFEKLKNNFQSVKFEDKNSKVYFMDDISNPYSIYELGNDEDFDYDIRIFRDIFEFSDNFSGRWFQFEEIFRYPYQGKSKELLDNFRNHIYQQFKLAGCDKAFFFPDQGSGQFLYDSINLASDEWIEYLNSGDFMEDGDEPVFFSINDYIEGKTFIKNRRDYVDVFIDDFRDMI